MGQKVNPHGFRVWPTLYKGWDSVLYAEKDYAEKLLQDLKVRSLIMKKYKLPPLPPSFPELDDCMIGFLENSNSSSRGPQRMQTDAARVLAP